jgi:hypothetical protein
MKTILQFLILFSGIVLFCAHPANAQKGIGNVYGIGQQQVLPDVETITGELVEIKTGPCENTTGYAVIGTHLFLKNNVNETVYNIHLGAAYAVDSFIARLSIGQNIEVHAFRTEQMDENHYVAKDVSANGHTIQLRDENLRPFWAGERASQRGRQFDTRRRGRW